MVSVKSQQAGGLLCISNSPGLFSDIGIKFPSERLIHSWGKAGNRLLHSLMRREFNEWLCLCGEM